jgi:hypothetical protein
MGEERIRMRSIVAAIGRLAVKGDNQFLHSHRGIGPGMEELHPT